MAEMRSKSVVWNFLGEVCIQRIFLIGKHAIINLRSWLAVSSH